MTRSSLSPVAVAVAAALLLCLVLADAAKLPSYFLPKCSKKLPDDAMAACIERIANKALNTLANGDRKLGFPSLRPLVVPRMALAQGTNTVGLNVTWEPAEIWGLGESTLYNYKTSYSGHHSSFDLIIPRFVLAGKYTSSGRVLLLPISGTGPSNVTVTNLRVHYEYDWPTRKGADGKLHYTVPSSDIHIISADAMTVKFIGLFNGDERLGTTMNAFLNENWRELIKELGPGMAEAVGEVVKLVVLRLGDLVPANDFYAE